MNPAIKLATDTIPSARGQIKMLIEMVLKFLSRDQDLLLLFLLEGRRIRDDGEFVVLVPGFLEFVQLADSILKQLAFEGELVPGVDPEAVRSGLMGAVEGLLRDQLLGRRTRFPAGYSEADIHAVCFRFLNSVLRNA